MSTDPKNSAASVTDTSPAQGIATYSNISFGQFVFGILPATLVGSVVNAAILLCLYWNQLDGGKPTEEVVAVPTEVVEEEDVTSHRFSPATMSHLRTRPGTSSPPGSDAAGGEVYVYHEPVKPNGNANHDDGAKQPASTDGIHQRRGGGVRAVNGEAGKDAHSFRSAEEKEVPMEPWKSALWKTCVYVITFGMLVALLLGLNMSWSAITAALALIVLDFKDARPCLEKVSYPLLLFFCGMFITVDGFNKTGIPSAFWEFMEPYARIDTPAGTVILALVILFLSNVASNVPTVLLLGARVAASAAAISPAAETNAWLILAWTSTVAGNLSLLGSAANLIVCEQARRSQQYGYTLSFFSHLQFGFPATLIVTGIGLLLIRTY
ncbi:hypothetical protein ACP70R_028054 [Stipagrostis hirtigluma subsp. patula]